MSWRNLPLLVALIAVAGPSPAEAWDSKCAVGAPNASVACDGGYEAARGRWITPHSEHNKIWSTMVPLAGLPDEYTVGEFSLNYYVERDDVDTGLFSPDIPSVYPSWALVHSSAKRTTSPAEMTQLADFSYSLFDWASGNETCPPAPDEPPGWDPSWCHHYFSHMGPINASHFLPMAEYFWAHYHALALERANACWELEENLTTEEKDRFERYRTGCEQLAIVLEAASHHFLQDAFSMGHTWERWGGNEVDDLDNLGQGILVAGMAGMIHGFKNTDIWILDSADDPMCAPAPTGTEIQYVDGRDGGLIDAVGDIFWPLVDPGSNDQDPLYIGESAALLGCTAASAREVYEAGAQLHGPLNPIADSIDGDRDPYGADCWDQRATNISVALGIGIHFGEYPNQSNLSSDVIFGGMSSVLLMSGLSMYLNPLTALPGAIATDVGLLMGAVSVDAMAVSAEVSIAAKLDPKGTAAGTTDLTPFLGILPNSHYVPTELGNPEVPPSSWVDPPMPWTIGETDPKAEQREVLSLAFADATAIDRCASFTSTDLYNLANYVAWTSVHEPEKRPAACGVCIDMVEPHVRVGTAASWDTDLEPLCSFVEGVDPEYVYVDGSTAEIGSSGLAAKHFCGCPWDAPLVLSSFPAEDPSDPDSIATFDPGSGLHENLCSGGGSPPDLGPSNRTDILPVPGALPSWAVSYPYLRELRLYPADCSPIAVEDTLAFSSPPSGAGPVALELTPDGTEIIVGAADPEDPCAPGAIHLVDALSLDINATVATSIGVGDVTVGEGADGTKILFTLPGDGQFSGQCLSWHLGQIDLEALRDFGEGGPTVAPDELPIIGDGTHNPTRIVANETGEFVVYTMAHAYGRIGVRHVPSGTTALLDSERVLDGVSSEPYEGSWDTPEDITLLDGPGAGELLIMYVNRTQTRNPLGDQCFQACDELMTNPWNNPDGQGLCYDTPNECAQPLCENAPWEECEFCVSAIPCGATGYVLLDVSTPESGIEEEARSSERGLAYAYANRIWLHEESGLAYVSYLNRSRLTTVNYTPSIGLWGDPGWEPDSWKRTEVGAWPIEIWGP